MPIVRTSISCRNDDGAQRTATVHPASRQLCDLPRRRRVCVMGAGCRAHTEVDDKSLEPEIDGPPVRIVEGRDDLRRIAIAAPAVPGTMMRLPSDPRRLARFVSSFQ